MKMVKNHVRLMFLPLASSRVKTGCPAFNILCMATCLQLCMFLNNVNNLIQTEANGGLISAGIDILQAEGMYMGYHVPTICMLQERLRDKRDLNNSGTRLVEAMLAGISRLFASIVDDAGLIEFGQN